MLQIRFPYSDWKPAIFVSGLQTVQTNSWLCNLHFLLLFENWANIDSFEKVNIVATLISVSHCILCWTVIWYDFLWLLCHRISWDKEIRTGLRTCFLYILPHLPFYYEDFIYISRLIAKWFLFFFYGSGWTKYSFYHFA